MATVRIDLDLLRQMVMPGLKATIDSASIDLAYGSLVLLLELSGEDVPDCAAAHLVMTQTVDHDHPAIVTTASLKPVD